ncbi:hypothetical protein V6N13_074438 [Hibiscus sabdariffa]
MWVILENFPLVALNDDILIYIAKRRGSIIRVDEDTSNKNKFDQARILISTSQATIIPPTVNIYVKNVNFYINISTVACEDQRCWIDGRLPNNNSVESSKDLVDEVTSCHFEDMEPFLNEETMKLIPTT